MNSVPPDGILSWYISTIPSVSSWTFSCIRSLLAAFPDSAAKNALVIAISIFSFSKGTFLPFLFTTLNFPGANILRSSLCSAGIFIVFSSFTSFFSILLHFQLRNFFLSGVRLSFLLFFYNLKP